MKCFHFSLLHIFSCVSGIWITFEIRYFYIIVFQLTLYHTFFINVIHQKETNRHKAHRITYFLNILLPSCMLMPLKQSVIKCIYIPSPNVFSNTFSLKNYSIFWFIIHLTLPPHIIMPYIAMFMQVLLMVMCQTNL